jgi:hypothetical protein
VSLKMVSSSVDAGDMRNETSQGRYCTEFGGCFTTNSYPLRSFASSTGMSSLIQKWNVIITHGFRRNKKTLTICDVIISTYGLQTFS